MNTLDIFTQDKIYKMSNIMLFNDVMNELLFKCSEAQVKFYLYSCSFDYDRAESIKRYFRATRNLKNEIFKNFYSLCLIDAGLSDYMKERVEAYKQREYE